MKKTLIVGAALTAFTAAAGAQQAQPASSVTLYGIVDVNLAQSETHAGATVTGMDELPNPRGSRFGFRGSENLGGGLRGIFQLEAGLSAKDGTTTSNNQLFNRHAWVGLAGGFGELTVGRQDTLHIRYTSPAFNGVRVRGQSALGQRATASTNGALLTYDKGPLRAALAYEYYDCAGVTGINRWNQATTVSGQYNLGFATVALGYQWTDRLLASAAANTLTSAASLPEHSAYNLGAIIPVSKQLALRVQYTASTTKTPAVGTTAASSRDYSRTGVSARYAFSSRTFGYVAYNQRDVDLPTAGNNKSSLGVGISHAF